LPSPFASLTTATIAIPHDPPHTATIRRLTGREYDQAQESHRSEFASGRTNAWAATFRRALERGATDPQVLKALADPLTGFDRFVLAKKGLVAWNYDRPVSPEAIEDLDDETIDHLAREVLRLTKPALFHVEPGDAEDARKNASGSSTVT